MATLWGEKKTFKGRKNKKNLEGQKKHLEGQKKHVEGQSRGSFAKTGGGSEERIRPYGAGKLFFCDRGMAPAPPATAPRKSTGSSSTRSPAASLTGSPVESTVSDDLVAALDAACPGSPASDDLVGALDAACAGSSAEVPEVVVLDDESDADVVVEDFIFKMGMQIETNENKINRIHIPKLNLVLIGVMMPELMMALLSKRRCHAS